MSITPDEVSAHIAGLPDVVAASAWGETAFFYNPGRKFARGTYFATIKLADGDNDRASDLTRAGVWRLNIGTQRATFVSVFGPPPARPAKGECIKGPWDFTALDALTPHPVYGWMAWMAILSPGEAHWQRCRSLIADAHARAQTTFEQRLRRAR
ncbi:DUF6194 family protein [Erythrobacter sanguineus]|jgi:hypothetical protein|uniref:DUF6194 domain-containing protein n=1 Tax=Erythrobacter sanguineus TaxID=198312 RepID=A0A1M7SIY7_9SPHN|nr:DUF6194 family protein [Erythrobacter sanguineus]SHN58425.1 hypothetical protein SAMN02745193_01820 [Erythrobacter sanguineus]